MSTTVEKNDAQAQRLAELEGVLQEYFSKTRRLGAALASVQKTCLDEETRRDFASSVAGEAHRISIDLVRRLLGFRR